MNLAFQKLWVFMSTHAMYFAMFAILENRLSPNRFSDIYSLPTPFLRLPSKVGHFRVLFMVKRSKISIGRCCLRKIGHLLPSQVHDGETKLRAMATFLTKYEFRTSIYGLTYLAIR